MMGGIKVEADSQMTTVPGLLLGECAAGLHGATGIVVVTRFPTYWYLEKGRRVCGPLMPRKTSNKHQPKTQVS